MLDRLVGIICHGGAGKLDSPDEYAKGVAAAVEEGYRLLRQSAHALEAAILAVRLMEDDPIFNAGTGSYPTFDGRTEMDAAVMTQDGRFGGVCCVSGVKNPVLVAEKVMTDTDHLLLSGAGAVEFARRMGFPEHDVATQRAAQKLETLRREGSPYYPKLNQLLGVGPEAKAEPGGGTVGAVAIDKYGKVAVAVSTGGTVGRLRGRVGDSAIPGAGIYAGASGAVCCTGHGEAILKLMLARDIVEKMKTLPGTAATIIAIAEAKRRKAQCGVIGFDARGAVCYGNTTPDFAYGYKVADRLFLFTDQRGKQHR